MPSKITIEKGMIMPNTDAINELLKQTQEKIKNDKDAAAKFKKNAEQYLANIGLNSDIRRELLSASKLQTRMSDCSFTCLFTTINCGGSVLNEMAFGMVHDKSK